MITAIVPAAGLSTRMGGDVSKPLLPWGKGTVIEQVVCYAVRHRRVSTSIVVTGHRREAVEAALAAYPVRSVFNPAYANGEMLASLQAGLRAVPPQRAGALLALADQPQMQPEVVATGPAGLCPAAIAQAIDRAQLPDAPRPSDCPAPLAVAGSARPGTGRLATQRDQPARRRHSATSSSTRPRCWPIWTRPNNINTP